MIIRLDIRKSLEQNAGQFFDQAKKAKGKLAKIESVIKKAEVDLAKAELDESQEQTTTPEKRSEKKWFEKFRWFISSDGFLCIGGRDSTSNEIVIKKHTTAADRVFHTEMAGSPFFVVQSEGREIPEQTLLEAAQACGTFSRAWKQALGYLEVYYILPEQVSKEAKSGEFIAKGAFMIYGKKTIMRVELAAAIGKTSEGLWMCGPESAISKHCSDIFLIKPGKDRPSDAAKMLRKKLGGHVDDIIRCLPPGPVRLVQKNPRDVPK